MSEEKLYELYGRKQAALDLVSQDYARAVDVLRRLRNGEFQPSQIEVFPDGRWIIKAAADVPSSETSVSDG